ncbi:pentatricopeptide repeat-containing protein At1g01970 [Punica granatum]|uniref:Uncharacterized protein n=2 Tax=Punica granatum TaxID=22663 RepID=A0A218VWK3_PUNGR|nr:pentatricopeptide repeat-containing protein At1g01970 [Punica granatum]OWM64954.1 hypothetical protein CDL15_Pgr028672 [Punica granatum]PKI67099.1 hypothetical protein CRG98_012520 [Punica granatum]
MDNSTCTLLYFTCPFPAITPRTSSSLRPITRFPTKVPSCRASLALSDAEGAEKVTLSEGRPKFKWVEAGRRATEAQKEAIAKLPWKMTKRCKALMRQIICFSGEGELADLLGAWVRIMKPKRADWLAVLKELKLSNHPLYLEVAELALPEKSFEANVRDYTKLIHSYGKQNQLTDAEKTLFTLKERGFTCDQVALTALLDMYSKAGDFSKAKETFEEIKLLDEPPDKRSYGAMIMACIRAGKLEEGEALLQEMSDQEITAGSEVYKALLRAYSVMGHAKGAQRAFDAIQLAGIVPDSRICGLLINAYSIAGLSERAHSAFENMRRVGIKPNDKCVALVVGAYEKEGKLSSALKFLMCLERDGISLGREASERLAAWFRRLGVVQEVELVLREFASVEAGANEHCIL